MSNGEAKGIYITTKGAVSPLLTKFWPVCIVINAYAISISIRSAPASYARAAPYP